MPLDEELGTVQRASGRGPAATTLRTIGEARAFLLELEPGRADRQHWQHAARLLLEAADSGNAAAVTRQLTLALLLDGLLRMPPATHGRRA